MNRQSYLLNCQVRVDPQAFWGSKYHAFENKK